MTIEKPFRELKFSSAHLIIVFLAILVLGVFIFLLGISVGKKQSQLTAMVSQFHGHQKRTGRPKARDPRGRRGADDGDASSARVAIPAVGGPTGNQERASLGEDGRRKKDGNPIRE